MSPSTKSKLCFDTGSPKRGRQIVSNYAMRVELPYGHSPYPIDVDGELVSAPRLPPPPPLDTLLDRALAGASFAGRRVTVIVSDATDRKSVV